MTSPSARSALSPPNRTTQRGRRAAPLGQDWYQAPLSVPPVDIAQMASGLWNLSTGRRPHRRGMTNHNDARQPALSGHEGLMTAERAEFTRCSGS